MRLREIPYNYTSFSDREIVLRFLDQTCWETINTLRQQRRTGRSARMLFEILGDMWVIQRNPYIQDDLLKHPKRWQSLHHALNHRLDAIAKRADHNTVVLSLVEQARYAVKDFVDDFTKQAQLRKQITQDFAKILRLDNICFDGLSRISHATDASDWRVEYPFVVFKPDDEKTIPAIINCACKLGLIMIPRGGGTGYTGGVIPLHAFTAVINLEKLNHINPIQYQTLPGCQQQVATIEVQAGVVTRRVSEHALAKKLIFAVDPTSQDASTIGGNIAMNAGGKKAVLFGTTLDNLASWRMADATGNILLIERLNHNLGKIHQQETVSFKMTRLDGITGKALAEPEILNMAGQDCRKVGLGKDVTDKFLGGLPGIQKEGCDGIITSAVFILHPQKKHSRTFCLEFFGDNLAQAVPSIVEIKDFLDVQADVDLAGLEHLDERYLKAVNYSTKAAHRLRPKMVLLGDLIGNDETLVAQAAATVVRLANNRQGEGFIAVSAEARAQFWLDRARTAAIAAHTNAFKINEDVVIPLPHLASYSDFIEQLNIEESLKNKCTIIESMIAFLNDYVFTDNAEQQNIIAEKKAKVLDILHEVKTTWQCFLEELLNPAKNVKHLLPNDIKYQRQESLFSLLQSRNLRISYRQAIEKPLKQIFSGEDYAELHRNWDAIHQKIRKSRLFIALHMHAGDGNIHTNIPVHSNDYDMLQAAERIVKRIMSKVVSLDGVVSGEHGIGITKLSFISQHAIDKFKQYKDTVDPHHIFNRGKLLDHNALDRAFTPSFSLLAQEALILEASELGELNSAIKDCLRCGKCKPKCQTHIPRANLFYSPRDKILATGAIIEAFLYEEQTRRGISSQHFTALNDIADHCTTCHHCKPPCPVNIDFGDVTIRMRNILRQRGQKKRSLGTKLTLAYLNTSSPLRIKILRQLLLNWGAKGQRLSRRLLKPLIKNGQLPKATTGKPVIKEQVIHFMRRPLPNNMALKPVRALLNIEDSRFIPILRDPQKINDDSDAVFYFPGCGSERMFSQVGLATLASLYSLGVQTVLPPGYLCCGYPQRAEGDDKTGKQISTTNRVLFHRIANTLNYLDIKTVIVSCGTCFDQLSAYHFDEIFPECRIMDIHEYLLEKQLTIKPNTQTDYLYHDPCHSPITHYDAVTVASTLMGKKVVKSNRCCGDAGTLSMSRPDIAEQLRFRKQQEISHGIKTFTGHDKVNNNNVKLLTTCPACVKGLSSYQESTGIATDYIVVELAQQLFGQHWQRDFIERINHGGTEQVLL